MARSEAWKLDKDTIIKGSLRLVIIWVLIFCLWIVPSIRMIWLGLYFRRVTAGKKQQKTGSWIISLSYCKQSMGRQNQFYFVEWDKMLSMIR